MDRQTEAREWLDYAARDLDAAKILSRHYPVSREIVCYHCQQAAEKYLKAYLISASTPFEKAHDLERRAALCAPFDDSLAMFRESLRYLTIFGVVTRYPSSVEIAEADVSEALEKAEALKDHLLPRITARI